MALYSWRTRTVELGGWLINWQGPEAIRVMSCGDDGVEFATYDPEQKKKYGQLGWGLWDQVARRRLRDDEIQNIGRSYTAWKLSLGAHSK